MLIAYELDEPRLRRDQQRLFTFSCTTVSEFQLIS